MGESAADPGVLLHLTVDPVELDDDCAYNPTGDALDVIDTWMT